MQADGGPSPSVRDRVITMIVEHALDDLEAAHVDLQTALTLTALAAWRECEQALVGRSEVVSPLGSTELNGSQPSEP